VSVLPYENEEDAIRIANNSSYGLSGAVFTKDPQKGWLWRSGSAPAM
jgi:acyl-CoA reductase-like NAD-dependent aldehyde dehydrogenase